jgi:F0F1-type ATP synthase membrane subunit c/vacuolar-type H+-ATPase subunit K
MAHAFASKSSWLVSLPSVRFYCSRRLWVSADGKSDGLVVSVLISGDLRSPMPLYTGFIQLGAGLSVGLAGLAAGFAIGIVGNAGVRGTAQQPRFVPFFVQDLPGAHFLPNSLFVGMILILSKFWDCSGAFLTCSAFSFRRSVSFAVFRPNLDLHAFSLGLYGLIIALIINVSLVLAQASPTKGFGADEGQRSSQRWHPLLILSMPDSL